MSRRCKPDHGLDDALGDGDEEVGEDLDYVEDEDEEDIDDC